MWQKSEANGIRSRQNRMITIISKCRITGDQNRDKDWYNSDIQKRR